MTTGRLEKIIDRDDILSPLIFQLALLLAIASCAAGAEFVGNQACAPCHSDIYASFERTPMANGSGRVGTGEPRERFDRTEFRDSAGAFAYRVGQEAGSYFFEFQQQGAQQPIEGTPPTGILCRKRIRRA